MAQLVRIDTHVTQDQLQFCKDHPQLDRSEHIRRALDLYMAKIKEEESTASGSISKPLGKGVDNGSRINIPSTSQES